MISVALVVFVLALLALVSRDAEHKALFIVAIGVFLVLAHGCSSLKREVAIDLAVAQKTAADGVGNAYLQFCEEVRRPRCIAEDETAKTSGKPQTKDDRIACLRPCDSATAERIDPFVEGLRAAQLVLFVALKEGKSDAEVDQARRDLQEAARRLFDVLRETGVTQMLEEARP